MQTDELPRVVVEPGPLAERWVTFGFPTDDPLAVAECRRAARTLLVDHFRLDWVPDLVPDVVTMVSELVTNVQQHAREAYPFGSFTLWHPKRWLILTVHDKGEMPPFSVVHGFGMRRAAWHEDGRGFDVVRALAADHLGVFDAVSDKDAENPGKVLRVKMLLPDVVWDHAPYRRLR
jgi:anti-sigma regulatory factor (Ser/Thr protein kinase)